MQQFEPLRCHRDVEIGYAGDIAARPAKAVDETETNRVAARQCEQFT